MLLAWVFITVLTCFRHTIASDELVGSYGLSVGALSQLSHGLKGSVYIVDSTRLRIREFSYDGKGPAGFFWIGVKGSASPAPDKNGQKIPNEKGSTARLPKYSDADIVLSLPPSMTTDKLAWLSVWCEDFAVDFGHVIFPSVLSVPRPTVVGKLSNPTHGLSSGNVTVTDVVTIKVDNFEFDGLEKDVYFVVGNNSGPTDKYVKLLRDGQSTVAPLGPYVNGVDVVLTLTSSTSNSSSSSVGSLRSFQFVGVHSYTADNTLARVDLPSTLNVPPHIDETTKKTDGA